MSFTEFKMSERPSLEQTESEVFDAIMMEDEHSQKRLESRKRRAYDSSRRTPNSYEEDRKTENVVTPLSMEESLIGSPPDRPQPHDTHLKTVNEWQKTPTRSRKTDDIAASPLSSLKGLSLRSPRLTKSPGITRSPGSSFSQVTQSPGIMQSPSSFSPFSGKNTFDHGVGPFLAPSPVRQVPVTILNQANSNEDGCIRSQNDSPKKAKLSPRPRGKVTSFLPQPKRNEADGKASSGIFFPVNDFTPSHETKPLSRRYPEKIRAPLTVKSINKESVQTAPKYVPPLKRKEFSDNSIHLEKPSFAQERQSRRGSLEETQMEDLLLGFTSQAKSLVDKPTEAEAHTSSLKTKDETLVHQSTIDKVPSQGPDMNEPSPIQSSTAKNTNKSFSFLRPRASHLNEDESKIDSSDSEQSFDSFFLNHPAGNNLPRPFSPLAHNSRLSILTSSDSLYGMDIIHENSASKASLCDIIPKTRSQCFCEDNTHGNPIGIRPSPSESSLASSIGLNLERMPSQSDLRSRDMVTPPAMAYSLSGPPPIRETYLTSSRELKSPPRTFLPSDETYHCPLENFSL